MKIVVVDDDAFILTVFARTLREMGYDDVSVNESGYDALEEIKSDPEAVKLVICDLNMPAMDGIEFIRILANMGYSNDLALLSGEHDRILATAANLAKAHRLNVVGTLAKPATRDQIQQLLNSSAKKNPFNSRESTLKQYEVFEIKEAIDEGQLINYYQPKVDVKSGKVAGFEALVRWQHPEDGLVNPVQFVPTAEAEGLIEDLTLAVLNMAIEQINRWHELGLRIPASINVSTLSLDSLYFPDFVELNARQAGVNPSFLVLELEGAELKDNAITVWEVLSRLRLKKIGLSINNFGRGNFSLAHLNDMPFNEVKIDQGFIQGASQSPSTRIIVDSTINMARELGVRVVGEGVADQEDWDFVKKLDIDQAQGFYIAKPMSPREAYQWLKNNGGVWKPDQ